jgi:hypothetical protein
MKLAKPKSNWVSITTAVGITCAVIGSCSYLFLLIIWRINGNWGRFYDRTIGPIILLTMLGSLICGMILLKPRKTIGKFLMAIAIGLFILGLMSPEL